MSWLVRHLRNSLLLPQPETRQKEVARIFGAILVVISVIFILYKAAADWKEIQSVQWHFRPRSLLLGFGAYSISLLLTASCWALIMGHISGVKTFWEHVRIFCLTNLSQRLPTLLPYLAARTEAYVALGVPPGFTLTAMVIEVAVTLLSGTLVAGLILILGVFPLKFNVFIIFFGLLFALTLILFPQRFLNIVNKALIYLETPPTIKVRHTASWAGLFMIVWLNSGVLYYFLISGLCEIPKEEIPFLIGVSAVSGLAGWLGQLIFLPTPAMRQLALAYLMSLEFPMPIAISFALFVRLCVMIFELIWAVIWMIVPIKITLFGPR